MESGPDARNDVLQVLVRRTPSGRPPDPGGTGSQRIEIKLSPARKQKLKRIVFAAVGACGLIIVAAAVTHLLRPSEEHDARADTSGADTNAAAATQLAEPPSGGRAAGAGPAAVGAAAAPAAAPVPSADIPQTGTMRLQRPATPGKVWLDGQKITAASATVACGKHQIKVGSRGKAHTVDIPCGGELKISR